MKFKKEVNEQHFNYYILSFLTEGSHNLNASREFMQSLTQKNNNRNVTYAKLPIPINTLFLTPQQIAI